ncbi:hypothetical protein E4U14_000985 [Claviceps sp. LM454 group G7]|nr:hypothetical protein E4U14_000985 [Claviceps sp. LM454 group G7]
MRSVISKTLRKKQLDKHRSDKLHRQTRKEALSIFDVDYEEFAEDVGRAAYTKQRAKEQRSHEQRRKGSLITIHTEENPKTGRDRKRSRFLVPEHRTKGKDAPVTSSSADRALIEDEKRVNFKIVVENVSAVPPNFALTQRLQVPIAFVIKSYIAQLRHIDGVSLQLILLAISLHIVINDFIPVIHPDPQSVRPRAVTSTGHPVKMDSLLERKCSGCKQMLPLCDFPSKKEKENTPHMCAVHRIMYFCNLEAVQTLRRIITWRQERIRNRRAAERAAKAAETSTTHSVPLPPSKACSGCGKQRPVTDFSLKIPQSDADGEKYACVDPARYVRRFPTEWHYRSGSTPTI